VLQNSTSQIWADAKVFLLSVASGPLGALGPLVPAPCFSRCPKKPPRKSGLRKSPALAGTVLGLPSDSALAGGISEAGLY
jgi:hypothetical protein